MGAKQWTTEEDSLLRDLAAQGLTAGQIADKLTGKTRNAVIGRVHRLGVGLQHIARGGKPKGQTTKWVRKSRQEPAPAPVPRKPVSSIRAIVARPPGRIGIMEIRDGLCRYPLGEPRHKDFHFCGNSSGDHVYCPEHMAIVYMRRP